MFELNSIPIKYADYSAREVPPPKVSLTDKYRRRLDRVVISDGKRKRKK